MYKILIVEDDITISTILKKHLNKWGYEAEIVSDFNNVMDNFIKYKPQIVILDITLPFYNGFYWCAEIRKVSKVPIIFASSASDNMNLIMAINMGADDFISKPFDLNVIVAKIQALLRRTYSFQGTMNILEHKKAVLDLNDMRFLYNDCKIELSKNEFRILKVLLENKNNVVSREEIMKQLWESDSFIDDNTLTVNVTRLRKRLSDIGVNDFIKTKKGIGYMVGD